MGSGRSPEPQVMALMHGLGAMLLDFVWRERGWSKPSTCLTLPHVSSCTAKGGDVRYVQTIDSRQAGDR